MRKSILLSLMAYVLCITVYGQATMNSVQTSDAKQAKVCRIGIIISSNDAETVWNAFRFGNFSAEEGDSVSVFLLAKGVEAPNAGNANYDVKEMMEKFVENGGKIFACGTCLRSRQQEGTNLCPMSTMADMYEIVKKSDKLLTF